MINGIHHISMHCRDLDRMIAFYRDAFGFEVVGEPFAWENSPEIDTLIAVPGSAARGAMLRAKNPFDKGYTHMCIDCTGVAEEMERLTALGMTFSPGQPVNMGHVISAYGRDPEGNLIEMQETAPDCDFRLARQEV